MAGEIRLPDIGDFKDVPVIEILVKPGQSVAKEDVLMTLESDKATLEVPSPDAGIIGEIKVKVGDKVSQGALLATWAFGGASAPAGGACRRDTFRDAAGRPDARRRTGWPRRFRMRRAGARRRSGRLCSRLPRRRSRRQRRAGRSPADARRSLPQCRLHSLEGAAARRQSDRRNRRDVRRMASSSRRRRSTSTGCGAGRRAWSNA